MNKEPNRASPLAKRQTPTIPSLASSSVTPPAVALLGSRLRPGFRWIPMPGFWVPTSGHP
eukprot:714320-Amorphochlora_amoeboformis.AAC.1